MRIAVLLSLVFACVPLPLRASDEAGRLYFSGEPAKALENYTREAEISHSSSAYLNAAFIAGELGRSEEQLAVAGAALRLYPEITELKRFRAAALSALGDFKKSAKLLAQITSGPDAEAADFAALGCAQLSINHTEEAEAAFKSALARDARLCAAHYLLGALYKAAGRPDDALKAFESAAACDSQFLEAKSEAAELQFQSGKHDLAWREYKKLSFAEPDYNRFKSRLAESEPFLTQKPDQLLPVKTIAAHHAIFGVKNPGGLKKLRVGIASRINGAPPDLNSISFVSSGAFTAADAKTGKKLFSGAGGSLWTVAVATDGVRAVITDSSGAVRGKFKDAVLIKQAKANGTFIVRNLLLAQGTAWALSADKELRGELEIRFNRAAKTVYPVNIVNIEEYLYGVIASEMPGNYPQEALKAQAVLARTYAIKSGHKHSDYGYDLCDGQDCQVYGGVAGENTAGNAAIDKTRSETLFYDGKPAYTVFFSNCGGGTHDGTNAGWGPYAYWRDNSDYIGFDIADAEPYMLNRLLKTRPPAYCALDAPTQYRWSRVIMPENIQAELGLSGTVEALVPLKRARSGHIGRIAVKTVSVRREIEKEYQIRKSLAAGVLRSGAFIVEPVYRDGKPAMFLLYGAGWGHGVGFCQSGARGRALSGFKYREILKHYYPGTELKKI